MQKKEEDDFSPSSFILNNLQLITLIKAIIKMWILTTFVARV
jgi:hypothetical protein